MSFQEATMEADRVLVVDDSSIARRQARVVIEGAGIPVDEAASGGEALTLCKSHRYTLVLSDYNMPVMNGLELLAALRRVPGYASTPFFMITTELTRELLAEGRAAGVKVWVVKPFEAAKLLRAVQTVMAAAAAGARAADSK